MTSPGCRPKSFAVEGLIALGVAAVALLWPGFGAIVWDAPLRAHQDFVVTLYNVKSLLSYGTIYANPQMAFPGQADYMAFPTPEILQLLLLRGLGWFTTNIFIVLNVFDALCFAVAALSVYAALRWTLVGRWLAAGGALMFAVCPLMVERAALHPYFCFTLIVPWVVRFCFLLPYQARARLGGVPLELGAAQALVLGGVAGSCGFYYAIFSAGLLLFTQVLLALGRARWVQLRPGTLALAAAGVVFFGWLAPHLWYMFDHHVGLPPRDVFQQTLYGIRLPDVVIPPLPPFAAKYFAYAATQEHISSEGNYSILGLWCIVGLFAALLTVLAAAFRAGAARRGLSRARRLPMIRLGVTLVLGILLFAMPYGLGLVFNLYFGGALRAQTRLGIFLLCLVIFLTLLLFGAWQRRTKPWPFYGATSVLLLLTLWPVWQGVAAEQGATWAAWLETKHGYAAVLERLEQQGLNTVAQLPAFYYPEGPGSAVFANSDPFWPYLLDASRQRRWSFGAMLPEPQWQILALTAKWPAPQFFAALRCQGFEALLVEKRALPDAMTAGFKAAARGQAQAQLLFEDEQRLVFDVRHVVRDEAVCAKIEETMP